MEGKRRVAALPWPVRLQFTPWAWRSGPGGSSATEWHMGCLLQSGGRVWMICTQGFLSAKYLFYGCHLQLPVQHQSLRALIEPRRTRFITVKTHLKWTLLWVIVQARILAGQQQHWQLSLIEALRPPHPYSIKDMCHSATYGIFLDVFINGFLQNLLKSHSELKTHTMIVSQNSTSKRRTVTLVMSVNK